MNDSILKRNGANFYGFESIDSSGKHHFHLIEMRGNGDLVLTENEISFNQWIVGNKYHIPLNRVTKVDVQAWHNLKIKFPQKVLRIYYQEDGETKIFGVSVGGQLSITKGWKDDAYLWKEKIESLLNK
ncbi:MAG: hypothetical protein JNM51_07335 [Bacteroidia bacterium]|nr:hypothetical protein [Bacteroidia bacterium]